jgi:hypothetical protein
MDDTRIQAFENMVKGLCDEFSQPYQGIAEDLNPYTDAFDTAFLVEGELYDLRVTATIEPITPVDPSCNGGFTVLYQEPLN